MSAIKCTMYDSWRDSNNICRYKNLTHSFSFEDQSETRMHSSGMYRPLLNRIPACTVGGGGTARGMYLPGGGGLCTCPGGVYLPRRGCTCPGGCTYLGGVPALGSVPALGGTYPGTIPPVDRQTSVKT